MPDQSVARKLPKLVDVSPKFATSSAQSGKQVKERYL